MSETRFPAIVAARTLPNRWDIVAGLCVLGVLAAVAHAARGTLAPLSAPDASTVSLNPIYLPYYALRTTLRMFGALVASLLFTLTYATVAAKSRRAGQLMIPVLDILQSVPILGFLSFTVVFFMSLVPGRVLGAELAALFAIFTSQAWNMAFSMYQSLTTIPGDLDEATRGFRLTAWQRFWRLEVPFAMPGLVWNTMMSMSGGWFFVVAAEVYSGGSINYVLPGIGSYVSLALDRRDIVAVFWAILTMLVVIVAYDQLLFRPLVAWSAKFRFETTAANDGPDPWMLALLRRTRLLRIAGDVMSAGLTAAGGLRLSGGAPRERKRAPPMLLRLGDVAWYAGLAIAVAAACWRVASFAAQTLHWSDLGVAVGLGLLTLLRVMVLMVLASLIWVPVGVWLGLRPHWARRAQPVAQFLAAFPANLLFPPFVLLIVRYHLNADVWLTPLMVLGTQWYILFNVIAGAAAFPGDLREAAANFRLRGWLWWARVIIPGILPYYVTGAITASGGSWNAAIVAEVASWGSTHLVAHGLGAYIAEATSRGDAGRIVLGIAVMSVFVLAVNRLLWRPLYAFAARRMVLS
jgi:NitT/TauT family transport system permease protein